MSEDEIIQMAVECGIIPWTNHEYIGDQKFTATDDGLDGDAASLIQFFQMAVAHEREECAKVCEEAASLFGNSGHIGVCITNAGAIRARGKE